jgi:cellulose biosynthesis protein BcsQ
VEAEKAGAGPVALIDTDPQGSLAAWWNVPHREDAARSPRSGVRPSSAMQQLEQSWHQAADHRHAACDHGRDLARHLSRPT